MEEETGGGVLLSLYGCGAAAADATVVAVVAVCVWGRGAPSADWRVVFFWYLRCAGDHGCRQSNLCGRGAHVLILRICRQSSMACDVHRRLMRFPALLRQLSIQ
jgi:hypothetical protein